MAHGTAATPRTRLLTAFAGVALGVLTVAVLFWAQTIFIPIALAVFFTFLLAPVVERLERWVGRTIAVVATVVVSAGLLFGIGWLVSQQVTDLVRTLNQPGYTENIAEKARFVRRFFQGGVVEDLKQLAREVKDNVAADAPLHGPPAPPRKEPVPTEPPATAEVAPATPWLTDLPGPLGKVAEGLAQTALVVVLVIFMLLRREDLRNRVIRLIGHGRLTVTTMAIDDAARRVSRFLVAQLGVNVGFGMVFAAALWWLGIPYAVLWGFLAAVMRYVPYLGVWLAIVPPIVLSLAVSPGWTLPLWVVGLVAVMEVTAANVVEPVVFGQSIGVSEVALLVSAAFWAWLWGPIGLVLAAPLTVCLVVLGKYVPQLEFFDVLLGDAPPLPARIVFYQRLLARDQDEAAGLVEKFARHAPPEQAYDEFLIPALAAAKRDRDRRDLVEADEKFIITAVAETVEELATSSSQEAGRSPQPESTDIENRELRAENCPLVLGVPARDAGDQLALRMLEHVLDPDKWSAEILPVTTLASELIERVKAMRPAIVCLASLPPGGLAHLRYLCKRVRHRFPELKIAVGVWGLDSDPAPYRDVLTSAGADHVGATLAETQAQLAEWLPVFTAAAEDRPTGDRPKVKERVGGTV